MSKKINVSVIVPVYNSELYIRETLISIINQTLKGFEIIIIDDGCTDNSIKIAEEVLIKGSVNYKIIHQINKGLPATRNVGINAADGKCVCFIDSDDIIEKNHLTCLYNLFENADINVAYSDFEVTTMKNRSGTECRLQKGEIKKQYDVIKSAQIRKHPIHACAFLIKKSFINTENLFFNEKLRFGEDSDYICRTLFLAGDKIGYTRMNTYKYLNRSGSIMKNITFEQGELFIYEFKKTILKLLDDGVAKRKILLSAYYRDIMGFLHCFAKCATQNEFCEIIKKIDINEMRGILMGFPDFRIKILTIMLCISPKLFYRFFNI